MTTKPKDIRAAAAFLEQKNATNISPKDFAAASAELSKSFADTLALISKLMMGGQAQGDFPQTAAALAAAGSGA